MLNKKIKTMEKANSEKMMDGLIQKAKILEKIQTITVFLTLGGIVVLFFLWYPVVSDLHVVYVLGIIIVFIICVMVGLWAWSLVLQSLLNKPLLKYFELYCEDIKTQQKQVIYSPKKYRELFDGFKRQCKENELIEKAWKSLFDQYAHYQRIKTVKGKVKVLDPIREVLNRVVYRFPVGEISFLQVKNIDYKSLTKYPEKEILLRYLEIEDLLRILPDTWINEEIYNILELRVPELGKVKDIVETNLSENKYCCLLISNAGIIHLIQSGASGVVLSYLVHCRCRHSSSKFLPETAMIRKMVFDKLISDGNIDQLLKFWPSDLLNHEFDRLEDFVPRNDLLRMVNR